MRTLWIRLAFALCLVATIAPWSGTGLRAAASGLPPGAISIPRVEAAGAAHVAARARRLAARQHRTVFHSAARIHPRSHSGLRHAAPRPFRFLPNQLLPCPSPWTCDDVGTTGQAGDANQNPDGSWYDTTYGGNIGYTSAGYNGGTADTFHFAYQSFGTAGTISAELTSLSGPTQYDPTGGLMIRQDTTPGSPFYYVALANGGVQVQYRLTPGSASQVLVGGIGATTPVYLEIQRTNFTFQALTSSTGQAGSWQPIPGSTIALPLTGSVLAGLADASNGCCGTTATYSGVTVTPTGQDSVDTCSAGWTCTDVPTLSPPGGQASIGGSTWDLYGTGAGLDTSFHDVYQNTNVDTVSISGQVSTLLPTGSPYDAAAGVALREDSVAGDRFYSVAVDQNGSVIVERRSYPGVPAQHLCLDGTWQTSGCPEPTVSLPIYLKVARSGFTFEAYTSETGNDNDWQPVTGSSYGITMLTTQASLVADSGGSPLPTTTEIDNVSPAGKGNAVTECASGFVCRDVGSPIPQAVSDAAGGAWSIDGSGGNTGIEGTTDNFRSVYQVAGSQATISARLTWQTPCGSPCIPPYTDVGGVMIRGGNDPKAAFYGLFVQPDGTLHYRYRQKDGDQVQTGGVTAVSLPVYLRVIQSGTSFSAFYSYAGGDGPWSLVPNSQVTANVESPATAGLAVTSGCGCGWMTSQFDTVSVRPYAILMENVGSPSGPWTACNCTPYPVNTATGAFWHTFGDLGIPGRGLPLALSHTYDSRNAASDGPLGFGWTDSYNLFLTTDSSGDITVHEENGSSVTFTPNGSAYTAPGWVYATLTQNGDGTFTFTRIHSQDHYTFSAPSISSAGQLLRETDRNGYTTSLSYSNGQLTTVTDPEGRSLTFTYNAAGRIATVSDGSRSESFGYFPDGTLETVTDVANHTTSFTYDANHLLLTMTDPRGTVIENEYDSQGRITQQTEDPTGLDRVWSFGYTANDDGSTSTTVTDPKQNVSVFTYEANELISRTLGVGTPQAATWSYRYDPATLRVASVTDPNGHVTSATYDASGNVLTTTDALNQTWQYTYDGLNDLTSAEDPLLITTSYSYDVNGNLTSISRPLNSNHYFAARLRVKAGTKQRPQPAKPAKHAWHHTAAHAVATPKATPTAPPSSSPSHAFRPLGGSPYATAVLADTPVVYYRLDEASGTTATDSSGHSHTGTYLSGATLGQSGATCDGDTAIGVDGAAVSLAASTFVPYNDLARSFEFWIKGTATTGTLFSYGKTTAANYAFELSLTSSTTLKFDSGTVSGSQSATFTSTKSLSDGAWHYVALTWSGSAMVVYVDGTSLGSKTLSAMATPYSSTLKIGVNASGSNAYVGNVDEFAIYSKALTAAEVSNHVNAVVCPTPTPTPTNTPTNTPTDTPTPSPTNTPTPTPTDTPTNTPTPTATPIPQGCTPASPAGTPSSSAAITYLGYDPNHPGDVTAVTDPNGHTTGITYDANGNISSVCDALGNLTTYGYDALGRVTSIVSPKGNIPGANPADYTTGIGYDPYGDETSAVDPLLHSASATYDPDGNLSTVKDPNGNETDYSYDSLNEATTVTSGVGTAVQSTTRYGYDADGNLTSWTDGENHTTSYGYDSLGRQTSITDPLLRTTSATYDGAGNLLTVLDPRGNTTSYSYDAADRLTGISHSDGTTPNVTYSYNAGDERIGMTDGTGSSSYVYDSLDRVVSSTDSAGNSVGYGYDIAGNLTSLTYPGGSNTVTRQYDADNQLTAITDWLQHTTSFGYASDGNLVLQSYPNTTTASYSYDRADQLTGITDTENGAALWSFGYGRDSSGQLSTANDPLDNQQHSYEYDALNRLTSDTAGTLATTWQYDKADALTGISDPISGTSTLGYDAAYELTSLSTVLNGTTTKSLTFSYNATGDRTGQTDSVSGQSTSFGYDQEDRLTSYAQGSTSASYGYNGDGLRMSKTVNGSSSQEVWDLAEGLPLMLSDGTDSYVTGPDGLPIEQISGTSATFLYQDQLGSTRGLIDSSGTVTATYTYGAYGTTTSHTGTASTPFQYAGQYTDAESGLQYLRARYYDPSTAQFLTVDPLAEETGQPYAYADGNPLGEADPSGLGCGLFGIGCAASGIAHAAGSAAHGATQAASWVAGGIARGARYAWGVLTAAQPHREQPSIRIDGVVITAAGVREIIRHLDRFSDSDPHYGDLGGAHNRAMIHRLDSIVQSLYRGEPCDVTQEDINFYEHELFEARLMDNGMTWSEAHEAALRHFGVRQVEIYPRDVVEAHPDYFGVPEFEYWGIPR